MPEIWSDHVKCLWRTTPRYLKESTYPRAIPPRRSWTPPTLEWILCFFDTIMYLHLLGFICSSCLSDHFSSSSISDWTARRSSIGCNIPQYVQQNIISIEDTVGMWRYANLCNAINVHWKEQGPQHWTLRYFRSNRNLAWNCSIHNNLLLRFLYVR